MFPGRYRGPARGVRRVPGAQGAQSSQHGPRTRGRGPELRRRRSGRSGRSGPDAQRPAEDGGRAASGHVQRGQKGARPQAPPCPRLRPVPRPPPRLRPFLALAPSPHPAPGLWYPTPCLSLLPARPRPAPEPAPPGVLRPGPTASGQPDA